MFARLVMPNETRFSEGSYGAMCGGAMILSSLSILPNTREAHKLRSTGLHLRQILMHEANRHRALANGAGNTVHRASSNVTRRENTG